MTPMRLTIDSDARRALKALDQLGDEAGPVALGVSLDTGERVAKEAERRLSASTRGEGVTAGNITVSHNLPSYLGGEGFRDTDSVFVYVRARRRPRNLPLWLEEGTRHMTPRPFLLPAARSEEAGHQRRMAQALQRAADRAGGR